MTERRHDPLEAAPPSRRTFLKGFVAAAFAAPVVASFSLDGIASATESSLGNQYLPNQSCDVVLGTVSFLQPINADGSSVFKAGRVVPVKVRITGTANGHQYTVVTLTVTRVDGVADPVNEATSAGAANEGDIFRYDAAADQYVYNLDTKALAPGKYRLSVTVKNGPDITCTSESVVEIGLR